MLSLVLTLLQSDVTIPRAGAGDYPTATKKCDEAAGLIESSPREAVEILDAILQNSKIEKRECRMRIEVQKGTYSKWYEFYPYQYRGRARLKLADGEANVERKKKLLEQAAEDFDESFNRRKLPSSRAYFEATKAKLKALKTTDVEEDAEPKFREGWKKFVNRNQYRQAAKFVETEGEDGWKQKYLNETKRLCGEYLSTVTVQFLEGLETIRSIETLTAMSAETFDRRFELTRTADLLGTTVAYVWCINVRGALESIRAGKDPLHELLAQAEAAAALDSAPENRWFSALETLAFDLVRQGIESRVREARDAPTAKRAELRKQADSFVTKWKMFEGQMRGSPELAKKIASRNVAALLDSFPVDDESLAPIVAAIRSSAESEDPDRTLAEAEKKLEGLSLDRLPLESRQTVLGYRIVAAALRGFLAGKTEDDLVGELRRLGAQLKQLDGSFDAKEFGPKIQGLFKRLLA